MALFELSEIITQILARSLRVDLQQAAFYLRAAHGDIRKAMQLHGGHLHSSACTLLLADGVLFDSRFGVNGTVVLQDLMCAGSGRSAATQVSDYSSKTVQRLLPSGARVNL